MAIRIVVHLQAHPSGGDALLEALAAEVPVARAMGGALELVVIRDLDDRDRFIVVHTWEKRADYEAYLAFRATQPGGGALIPLLASYEIQYGETVGTY
jgi:quinol monooxygenase YgiN